VIARPGAQTGHVPSPVKCLLVDDLEENLLALSALLRGDGVELLQAKSASEALELLLANDVALAILDVQMPDIDGFALAEIMRGSERTRNVPIIFVTAGARDQQRLFKGYETGAVDFMFKPIDAHIIRSKADVFFQLYRQKQQLAQQLHERTETLRLNEMFTAVLGHDLRGPLSAILMAAQVLSSRPDESVQKIGARLSRSGHWMSRMIEDLLDLARVRLGGGIPIQRVRCDIGALVERVVHERQSTFPNRTIRVDLAGDLVGNWDEDRLAQAMINLIGNALIHGETAEPIDVRVNGRATDSVVLEVSNGGVIPPDVLPHIFDPFRSGRRQSTRSEGLGLGLYIVQQIVGAHDGRVDVQSEMNERDRTSFRVVLPRG
jgi:two-component system sensor histidine kinase/response regulator